MSPRRRDAGAELFLAGALLGSALAMTSCGTSPSPSVVTIAQPPAAPPQAPPELAREPTGEPSPLHPICDRLPPPRDAYCTAEARAEDRASCHELVDVHLPEVAVATLQCFADGCGHCPFVVCRWEAIAAALGPGLPSCDVLEPAFRDSCNAFAASLSSEGRRRLASCLAGAEGLKTECYTEPSLVPCSPHDQEPFGH